MALTDTFVRQVKHTGNPAGDKHTDGAGMYLLVKAPGKYWRLDYRFAGKRKTLALGTYPEVSLAKARQRRDKSRELLAEGLDPGLAKRAEKLATAAAAANTFEALARELHATKAGAWSPKYGARWIERMEKDLFPHVGRLALPDISAPMLLEVLRKVEKRGANETAHTLRQTAGQVFRYGIQTGRCERNPVADLHGALKPLVVKHMTAPSFRCACVVPAAAVTSRYRRVTGSRHGPTRRTACAGAARTARRACPPETVCCWT